MSIRLIPSLEVQRDLVALPRTMERFDAYVASMVGPNDEVTLPLFLFNPMAREHVADVIDRLLADDAEDVAADAARDAEARLPDVRGDVGVVLIVIDDARGGWTNRFITDFELRFTDHSGYPRWALVPVWSSEGADPERVRADTLRAIHRTAQLRRRGLPTTLRDMLWQEGAASAFAGSAERTLEAEDLTYTRAVIDQYGDVTDRPTQMAVLYGDEAAREVGYEPLGLSPWAGIAAAYEIGRQT